MLAGCTTGAGSDTAPTESAPDLAEALDADQVRAGVVTDPRALFGGISSEGAPGDVKLYNDRVRFVIEAVGDSSYYGDYGGALIDADVVRPDGQPGRDMLDELVPMSSFARMCDATSVEVVEDGSAGVARVRVQGPAAPMRLITGAVESPDAVPDYDLWMTTEYVLRPGAWHVEITTTVENRDAREFIAAIGIFGIYAQEVAALWHPRVGFEDADGDAIVIEAVVGQQNEGVLAVLPAEGALTPSSVGDLVSALAAGISGFEESATVAPGETRSWTTRFGVAPDLATLEAERLDREGITGAGFSGTVTAAGAPLAGARVHVLDDAGRPVSMGVTDSAGAYDVRAEGGASVVVSGRGRSLFPDLPPGHGHVGAYDRSADGALASLAVGALPIAFAEGYGVASAGSAELTPPGTLAVTIADGGAAAVIVDRLDGEAAVDERLVPGRPGGHAALAFVNDGAMELPLEPGSYRVTVHRGVRYEVYTEDVEVSSAATTAVAASLAAAYTLDGIHTFDPHSHASPSADGSIPMADRILVMAATGVDIHVGTDHDHVVDYRPIVTTLGLGDRLQSVVADEVSPVVAGHFNAYPATQTGAANGGAPRWWQEIRTTPELFAFIRRQLGPDVVIQANHPISGSGLFSAANYNPAAGLIEDADHWSEDFDAMELINAGHYADYFPYYLDLSARGKRITPVSVSDSHSWTGGDPGFNVTFLHTGGSLAEFDSTALRGAMAARATVASSGPYIEATLDGTWAPGREVAPGRLDVRVLAPTWIPVTDLTLWRDGVAIEARTCTGTAPEWCTTSFDLPSDLDGSYVVVASSVAPLTAIWTGRAAWAATSAIYVDVGGDGWTAPLPALIVQE